MRGKIFCAFTGRYLKRFPQIPWVLNGTLASSFGLCYAKNRKGVAVLLTEEQRAHDLALICVLQSLLKSDQEILPIREDLEDLCENYQTFYQSFLDHLNKQSP